ncbi:MAG: (2Fe-2S)-binding protein [Burkholderiales bacterium]|nr:(2Fe-2S)-binding protein [Burkholderiales bacterium]
MKRREFLEVCGAMAGAAGLAAADAARAQAGSRSYRPALLVDIHGVPILATKLAAETNFVFQYPYAATPCFLLRLPKAVRSPATLRRENGARYEWSGGVGPDRTIVAFSAICAHKLAYPTKEVSFIRYQRERSPTSGGAVIHCCADHSVYDPLEGARVVSGPAPQPLAAIVLEYEAATDHLTATGTVGAEQFDAFFAKYEFKLAIDYGGRGRRPVEATTVVRELSAYCRNTIQC